MECNVAAPPVSTRKLSRPTSSPVVAVADLSSFLAPRPNYDNTKQSELVNYEDIL
jgi:hypothetical protein